VRNPHRHSHTLLELQVFKVNTPRVAQSVHCALLAVQVRAADVVVLSKCDLASLAGMAAVEDALQQLVPGVRMLRARFGQVGTAQCCCCLCVLRPCVIALGSMHDSSNLCQLLLCRGTHL
jgi:G3E family GTPase